MVGDTKEHWRVLCEQASKEQDPVKLRKLIAQINQLLEDKYERANSNSVSKRDSETQREA
jgi:hypothetical protein